MSSNSDMTELINKLNNINSSSVIKLYNGITFKLSDIESINTPITLDCLYNKINNIISVNHSTISLEKFIFSLRHGKISSTSLDHSLFKDIKHKKSDANRKFSKWVANLLLFKQPISFTVIEMYNDILYIPDSMIKMNSLISFIYNKEPIYDLFKFSNSNVIWFNNLDKSVQTEILSLPVNITKIYPYNKDKNMDEYNHIIALLMNK